MSVFLLSSCNDYSFSLSTLCVPREIHPRVFPARRQRQDKSSRWKKAHACDSHISWETCRVDERYRNALPLVKIMWTKKRGKQTFLSWVFLSLLLSLLQQCFRTLKFSFNSSFRIFLPVTHLIISTFFVLLFLVYTKKNREII